MGKESGGELLQSWIDLIFRRGIKIEGKIKRLKLVLDHWGLLFEVEGDSEWVEVEREVVDWDRVDKTLGKDKKESERDLKWYYGLRGSWSMTNSWNFGITT